MAQGGSSWTLITVTFNSAKALRTFWRPVPNDVTWLVVDNASADDTVDVASALGARVISLDRNVGFSRANNVGLAEASTEYTAFINPDVTVGFDDLPCLAETISATAGLVAPQLLNGDGTIQLNGRGLPFLRRKMANRGWRIGDSDALSEYALQGSADERLLPVAWVMGAALAGRTESFRSLGGWDERFFIYYEDHEIGLRAWEEGMGVCIDPRITWVHGWARETASGFSWRAWQHELASAARFYSARPDLLSRRLGRRWPGQRTSAADVGEFVRRQRARRPH